MFDYKSFAEDMSEQAKDLVNADFSQKEKDYIIKTIKDFTYLSGEALVNDDTLNFSDEENAFIVQVIAEWTFHKAVDIIRSGISEKYYDSIMQKIAFTAFEICKHGIIKKLDQAEHLNLIEYHIQKCYAECVEELHTKGIITDEEKDKARQQCSIEVLAEKYKHKDTENDEVFEPEKKDYYANFKTRQPKKLIKDNEFLQNIYKFFNKYKITIIASFLLIIILTKLYLSSLIDLGVLIRCCIIWTTIVIICSYIVLKNNIKRQLNELKAVRQQMQDLVDPDKMFNRLGVEPIILSVGRNLHLIADSDQDGELLAKIAAMRQRLTDELGYIIPNIHVIDSSKLDANQYTIQIRGNLVTSGYVYPEKYMVNADNWAAIHSEIPEDAIVGMDPAYRTQVYWIDKKNISDSSITATSAEDVIITHFEEILIKHVDEILTIKDVYKYVDIVKQEYSSEIADGVTELLSPADIRRIFVTLIREKISIKDITYIFDKMYDYARFTTNPYAISERIRLALGRQICLANADENNVLYAVELSEQWESLLRASVQTTELTPICHLNGV